MEDYVVVNEKRQSVHDYLEKHDVRNIMEALTRRLMSERPVGDVRSSLQTYLRDMQKKSTEITEQERHDKLSVALRPFVSNVLQRNLTKRHCQSHQEVPGFWNSHAAVLSVDISKSTHGLFFNDEEKEEIYTVIVDSASSPHRCAQKINNFWSQILKICVEDFAGEVVDLHADRLIVCWMGTEEELSIGVAVAAKCALALLKSTEEKNDLKIRCGFSGGCLNGEVFSTTRSEASTTLQPDCFLVVRGAPIQETGELIDQASAGEICFYGESVDHFFQHDDEIVLTHHQKGKVNILESLLLQSEKNEDVNQFIESFHLQQRQQAMMDETLKKRFIPVSVVKQLEEMMSVEQLQASPIPTRIADMKKLCVLQIACSQPGQQMMNWFREVQEVTDAAQIPILQVQVSSNSKEGLHVTAAVDFTETAVPLVLEACRALQEKDIACVISVTVGDCLCAVLGDANIHCRWNMTGTACIRGDQLLDTALRGDIGGSMVLVDESVYEASAEAVSCLQLYDRSPVDVPSSSIPIVVYRLLPRDTLSLISPAATKIAKTFSFSPHIHAEKEQQLYSWIQNYFDVKNEFLHAIGAVLIHGGPQVGKRVMCQRAAGRSGLIPFLHYCHAGGNSLQLASTFASWFIHHPHSELRCLANKIVLYQQNKQFTKAHDECVKLVTTILTEGFHYCLVVQHLQLLDEFSLSIIRTALQIDSTSIHTQCSAAPGRFLFACTYLSLYSCPTPKEMVISLVALPELSDSTTSIPIFQLESVVPKEDLKNAIPQVFDVEADETWLEEYGEATGWNIGYFIARVRKVQKISSEVAKGREGGHGWVGITPSCALTIIPGQACQLRKLTVYNISSSIAGEFLRQYQRLPRLHQLVLKIVFVATRLAFSCWGVEVSLSVLQRAFDELVSADDVDGTDGAPMLSVVLHELVDLSMVNIREFKEVAEGGGWLKTRVISFACPALGDVIFEQLESSSNVASRIATVLLNAYNISLPSTGDATADNNTKMTSTIVPSFCSDKTAFEFFLLMAALHGQVGQRHQQLEWWTWGNQCLQLKSCLYKSSEFDDKKRIIQSEIESRKHDEVIKTKVLGAKFLYNSNPELMAKKCAIIHSDVATFRNYCAPLSLGSIGTYLTVLSRNTFHLLRKSHGASNEEVRLLARSNQSAFQKFKSQVTQLEKVLGREGFGLPADELIHEANALENLVLDLPQSEIAVMEKISLFRTVIIAEYVTNRIQRIHQLVIKWRGRPLSHWVEDASLVDAAVQKALAIIQKYHSSGSSVGSDASKTEGNHSSLVNEVLLALTVEKWQPPILEEYLPLFLYPTVDMLTDRLLHRRRVAEDEVAATLQHAHQLIDLESWLMVSALLSQPQSEGL